MQDPTRLQEQVDEITMRAEARAAAAEDHRQIASQRLAETERDLAKFRALLESFTIGEQLILQRRDQLLKQETPPGPAVFEGLVTAVEELQRLQRQAQEMILKHEGAYTALQALEETLKQRGIDATSRARGAQVQGQKAVDVAEQRETSETPEAPEAPQNAPSLLDTLTGAGDGEPAKEPMSASRKKAGKRSRQKPES